MMKLLGSGFVVAILLLACAASLEAGADLVWRNTTTGAVALWLLDGLNVRDGQVLATVPLDWQVVGVGDVNGDGQADLVWRNTTTGAVGLWLLDGLNIKDGQVLATAPLDWQVVGVGAIGPPGDTGIVHENCEAIQQAINNLPSSGGEIVISAGMHICSAPIVIDRDNVLLRGQGPATVLRLADAANAPVLILGQAVAVPSITRRNIHIGDLVIDGNRANQTFECRGGPCGPDHPLRNNGISVRRCEDCQVERVTVFSARSGGLVSELTSRRVTVRDYTAFDNHFDGLAAYETEDSTFAGINVHSNLGAGLSFDIRFNNNIISNAIITNNGTVGIFMRDSHDNSFNSLQIHNNSQHGIFLAQVDTDVTKPAAGNTFTGVVVARSGGAGLRVNDASCVNNLVVGSQFTQNASGCISEAVPGLVQAFGTICH